MKRHIFSAIAVLMCLSIILPACNAKKEEDVPVFSQPDDDIFAQNPAGSDNTGEAALIAGGGENGSLFSDITRIGDELPVSRALVSKMLALTFKSKANIDGLPRFIEFTDVQEGKWYDRYINTAISEGLMSGGGTEFYPDAALTLEQAQILLDKLDPDNKIKMVVNDENRNKPISYELWVDLYCQLLQNLSGGKSIYEAFGIYSDDVVVMVTPETFSELKPYNMITDTGALSYAGYSFEQYIDKSVRILEKDGEVIAALGIRSETPNIRSALIVGMTDENITVFSGGAERTYAFKSDETLEGDICDIMISGKNALKVTAYAQKIGGTIVKVTSSSVELEEYGRFNTSEHFKIYSTVSSKALWKRSSNLTVGTDIAQYVIYNGEIVAAVITKTAKLDNIRVAVSKTGFKGYIHDSVSLTGTTDFVVTDGDSTTLYKAGDVYSVTTPMDNDGKMYQRVSVKPVSTDGKIQITSIKRNWPGDESPKYRGRIELILEPSGYSIVNELSLEEYLYAVVPSEIPTNFGLEALKVQAITARSYAYNQFYTNGYARYGANVDDSVSCQVYNNIPENAASIQAVDETKGQFLAYRGDIISANFFSTSAGVTANSGEVWAANGKSFPSSSPAYLSSVKQYTEGDYGDLSKEENAAAFFKDTTVKSYDDGFSWFRWNVTMTGKEVEAAINANLKTRYNASPNLITTLTDGIYRSVPVETIGTLRDMEVVQRGEAGNIIKLKIIGTEATVMVEAEYNIRMLITPVQHVSGGKAIEISRLNAASVSNYSLMPSAFFVFDKTFDDNGNISGVVFYGGGNGHGVGMSQNGVKGMIDAGYNCEQILKHYYKGTEIIRQ